MQDEQSQHERKHEDSQRTPGASGHPEPGSGHDDSKTTTVADGPPRHPVDGQPGAFGDASERPAEGNNAAEQRGIAD